MNGLKQPQLRKPDEWLIFSFGPGQQAFLSPQDWTQLPSEAFQPRHKITGPTAPPDCPDHDSMLAAVESDTVTFLTPVDDSEPSEQYLNLNIDCSALHCGPLLDFTTTAVDSICSLAEQVGAWAEGLLFHIVIIGNCVCVCVCLCTSMHVCVCAL